MTIKEFERLNTSEKDELVMDHGVFISNFDEGYVMVDVYKLYNFFVKFCYDLRKNSNPEIIAFSVTADLLATAGHVDQFSKN